MSILVSHPTGNANVRAAVQGFSQAGLLSQFFTGLASFEGSFLDKLGQFGPLQEVRRRRFDQEIEHLTTSFPLREAARLLSLKAGFTPLTRHETGVLSVDSVYRHLDTSVASQLMKNKYKGVKAVYSYEDGALTTFRKARELGIFTLYDLPIGYWRTARRLLQSEAERWPDWQSTLTGFKDSPAKLSRKDEELQLADAIFVASSFTAKTLEDYPGILPKPHVIPYGFPTVAEKREYSGLQNRKRLKLLFVGSLSQRKGIADLFSITDSLKDFVELTIVGKKPTEECQSLNKALYRHKWIPSLPHKDVLLLMQQQDILLFPSLFEGFGLVITEAMSQGLPVITTDRTAGPDLITHGENGWLIKAGSTDRLQEAVEYFLTYTPQISTVGREARETAHRRPWSVYSCELAKNVDYIIQTK